MKKYLNVGLTVMFLIPISNIVYSQNLLISLTKQNVTSEECFLVVTKGNVLKSTPTSFGHTDLKIVYKSYIYAVELHENIEPVSDEEREVRREFGLPTAPANGVRCREKQKLTLHEE